MHPAIVILKAELQNYLGLGEQLSSISERVMELPAECHYYPKRGSFVEFIRLLIKYDLDYRLEYVDQ